jgi:hypothetical protein
MPQLDYLLFFIHFVLVVKAFSFLYILFSFYVVVLLLEEKQIRLFAQKIIVLVKRGNQLALAGRH